MRLLAAYIDGHREGADRHWVTTCDEACERQLGAMVSLHIRSRSFAALDDAVEVSIRKGQQLIDEQGERLFDR